MADEFLEPGPDEEGYEEAPVTPGELPVPEPDDGPSEETPASYRLTWDSLGSRLFKIGIDRGVLYPMVDGNYQNGVAWSGLTGIDVSIGGREKTALYTRDRKARILLSPEEYGGTIKAFYYPDEFDACIGDDLLLGGITLGQQDRTPFGLSYRTIIGNDILGQKFAYKLHVIYESYVISITDTESTINESLSPTEFSWAFESIPVEIDGYNPISHIAIDSRKFSTEIMTALEDALWGTDETPSRLLLPQEIYDIVLAGLPYEGFPKPGVYPDLEIYPSSQ